MLPSVIADLLVPGSEEYPGSAPVTRREGAGSRPRGAVTVPMPPYCVPRYPSLPSAVPSRPDPVASRPPNGAGGGRWWPSPRLRSGLGSGVRAPARRPELLEDRQQVGAEERVVLRHREVADAGHGAAAGTRDRGD